MRRCFGFTLIELIAVMTILAVVAIAAAPFAIDLREQARIARMKAVIASVEPATHKQFLQRQAIGWCLNSVRNCIQGHYYAPLVNGGNQDILTGFNGGVFLEEAPYDNTKIVQRWWVTDTGKTSAQTWLSPDLTMGETRSCTATLDGTTESVRFTIYGCP